MSSWLRAGLASALACGMLVPRSARADVAGPTSAATATSDRPPPTWRDRYDRARTDLVEGRFRKAEIAFRALALEARGERDRALALEMARLAAEYAERDEAGNVDPVLHAAVRRPRQADIRTPDELMLLYGSSFLYGAGSGVWFLLETAPDSALTAVLPFAALTAAPVIAVATLDGYRKLPRGVPHAISAGLYLGLAQGVWLSAFQHARARRIATSTDPETRVSWSAETTAGVLWGAATTGAILGGLLGSALPTTPGRVSFAASTTMWSGTVVGLAAASVLPDDDRRTERGFLAAGAGLNAGLAAGLLLAGPLSPSVARVRLVDLLGLGGALVMTGGYLSLASDVDPRTAQGLAAIGAGLGLTGGWLATMGMPKQVATSPSGTQGGLALRPSIVPAPGGATLGVAGTL